MSPLAGLIANQIAGNVHALFISPIHVNLSWLGGSHPQSGIITLIEIITPKLPPFWIHDTLCYHHAMFLNLDFCVVIPDNFQFKWLMRAKNVSFEGDDPPWKC